MAKETKIWFTAKDLADRYGLSVGSIVNWRTVGEGPKFKKLGKGVNAPVRYHIDDVLRFEKQKDKKK